MLTHVHKVFAGLRWDSTLLKKWNIYFLLRRMQNSWWLAHLSKGEEVRVEMELVEMMLASVYWPDAGSLSDRTLKGCVRSSCQTAQWVGLSTGRWSASGRGGPDASGRKIMPRGAYWKRPDAGASASGQFYRSVRSASRPLKSDEQHLKQGTRGVNHVTGRWGPASGRSDRSVRSPRVVPSEGVQRLYFMGASI